MFGMCINKKVVAGLAVAGVALYLVAPNLIGAALPLLILAACPLSMVVMMKAMSGSNQQSEPTTAGDNEGTDTDIDAELASLRAEVARLREDPTARNAGPHGPAPMR